MSRGPTLQDLLFWATVEEKDATRECCKATLRIMVKKIEQCIHTYTGKEAQHEPRRSDNARPQ